MTDVDKPNQLPPEAVLRITDVGDRLAYNLQALEDENASTYGKSEPKLRNILWANFLSAAFSAQDVVLEIAKEWCPDFGNSIAAVAKEDEALRYVREARNAEEHRGRAAADRPFSRVAGVRILNGRPGLLIEREVFELRPVTTWGKRPETIPVPTRHLGQPLERLTAKSLAGCTGRWWLNVCENIRSGDYRLP